MKIVLILIFLPLLTFLNSCDNVSYPKENLDKNLIDLVKKETGLDSVVTIVGKTIYLDIEIDGFLSDDTVALTGAFEKMQIAVGGIMRVILSSDSDIKFMVVQAYTPDKTVLISIIQNIDDFKSFYYQRISKSDYESRMILETQTNKKSIANLLKTKHAITLDEYVGRMILSSITSKFRSNPFLAELMSPLKLRFVEVKNKTLLLSTDANSVDSQTKQTLQTSLLTQTKLYTQKYQVEIQKIILLTPTQKPILTLPVSSSSSLRA